MSKHQVSSKSKRKNTALVNNNSTLVNNDCSRVHHQTQETTASSSSNRINENTQNYLDLQNIDSAVKIGNTTEDINILITSKIDIVDNHPVTFTNARFISDTKLVLCLMRKNIPIPKLK